MRMYSEENLAQVNFEDVQALVISKSFSTGYRKNGHSMIMRNTESLEIGEMESLTTPLLITTIPITFMGVNGIGDGKRDIPLISGTLAPEMEEVYVNELLETMDAV